ncbi:MAG: hypothetical protein GOP50_06475 [Candidatus Heimdallarchaeota archaeon]|nr:hypothetical protein [Candidatus Heimdallarchaeota archaeon]
MKNKKIYSFTFILLVTITIGLGQLTNFKATAADDPTEPIFEGFAAEGYDETNAINFNEETEITVEYSVGRYAEVAGINIYGLGSGLNLAPTDGLALNFSYSLKERTYYEGSFTLTNLTQFRGYAWVGDINNGTIEDLDVFNHLDAWHYLYVNEDGTPPEFIRFYNASSVINNPSVYRAAANKSDKPIMVVYRVYGGTPTDLVTVVTSVYRDVITNASVNVFDGYLNVIKMNFSVESETYVEFNATIEFNDRTLYVCANNSYGWDSWGSLNELRTTMDIKALYNGYDFYSQPTLEDKLTDVDNIRLNITTYNTTETESFGINYYVEESADNDTRIIPWTETAATLNQTYYEINAADNNETIREYLVSLGSFSAGNILFYEAYNIYYGEYYNETYGQMNRLTIHDSLPSLSLFPLNSSYINRNNITFWYTADIARGEITEATLDFDDGSPIEILGTGDDNITYHIYPEVTGSFNATLNVTINIIRETDVPILINNTANVVIYLDFEPPELTILDRTSNDTDIVDGYVELYFDYTDDYTGIFRVWVFWGDGTTSNVTGDNYVNHYYTNSSTYIITIMAEDKAGNQFNLTIIYNVVFPEIPIITPTPFAIIPAIFSIMLVGYVVKKKKDQRTQ